MHTIARDGRYPFAIAAAGLVSFALFLLMHALVATERHPAAEAPPSTGLSVVEVHHARVRPHPPRSAPKRPHAPPRPPHAPLGGGTHAPRGLPPIMRLGHFAPAWTPGPRFVPGRWTPGGAGDAGLRVKWRFRPGYPPRAAMLGVEGVVAACFTVRADGSVADARVVGASSPQARQLLAAAALQAVSRWRFFPRKVAGRAVATRDVCQTVRFRLGR